MAQNLLDFDGAKSEEHKERGMKIAADAKPKILETAREIARELLRGNSKGITADDVVQELVMRGFSVHCLGNSAGSIFRTKDFVSTGETRKSVRVHAHSNKLTVWKLKDGNQ